MTIELVVFDMAGTTVFDGDSVADCFRAALAPAGVVPERASLAAVMGLPKPEAIRRLFGEAGIEPDPARVDAIHGDFVRRMRDYYATDPAVREVPGAGEAFAVLRRAGVRVGLDTGFSREIVDVILDRLGWQKAVDATVASNEVPRGRPFPDMIHTLMARLGVTDSKRVAKVGDTLSDLEQGTAAGCGLVIGVTSGTYARAELIAGPHTHIVASVAEVPALVLGRLA